MYTKPITQDFSRIQISNDPKGNRKRDLDVTIFTMIAGEIHLHCLVYYCEDNYVRLAEDGSERNRPYERLLRAKNTTRLNPITFGVETIATITETLPDETTYDRPETQEEFEARTIGEFDFYIAYLGNAIVLKNMLLQSVAVSDSRGLFNI
jgi:hypothetical protein